MKNKLTSFDAQENETIHDYGKIYEVEETLNSERLKIGASKNQIGLLLDFLDCLNPPYFILYVLVVSRLKNEHGRYQSPLLETKQEVIDFLLDFKEFLETDARHHFWIGTANNNGTLIFDQHDVIYAYGPINAFKQILEKLDFKEEEFLFPAPHCHHFHDSNDVFEKEILNYWEWSLFPLTDNDEYD
ncbi:hypothetical protein [Adhaeribacter pallidiroseus]|uniref:Uncharacterized protein n=1 Tax=Adhaeribacter pallidiroseus TaxID=2072847 RepID=A0A369QM97_9BACT|nr:hypothetical protein [Adhaeribacter pallidiroseus]RDC65470.1 hypothetical protein AHMF7616_04100 [Adhaeribacter pallidiroseus]